MAQTLNLNIKGLYTYASELSGVPLGALTVADDVNISRSNIVEPRRGFNPLAYDPAAVITKLIPYDSLLFGHSGTVFYLYNSGSGWASRGSITTPTNATTIKSVASNGCLYLTTNTGIYKMDNTASSVYLAGITKGTVIASNGALTGSGTAVTVSSSTARSLAYRYLLGRKDNAGTVVYGGVSGRYELTTSTTNGGYDVPLRVYLPSGIDNTYFLQVYRTASTTGTANDEMQLCYEYPITSGDISTGYYNFTDIVPDDLLGASLYTSPSQQGIINDNAQPPFARDIAEFKGHMFFADVKSKERYSFTLIAVDGSQGVVLNDTITITRGATTETYTAKASENVGSKHFQFYTTGTPAQDIDQTARSLVNIINQGSALVYAYLMSTGEGDLPGKIMLEERTYGNAEFTVTASRATSWSPQLASTSNANQTSANDEFVNGLMFSKQGIPEAVPLKNIIRVGASDDRIVRIVPLRDGLFIFKEKDGIYVLRGENEASFSVQILDSTAKVVVADTLVPVNNLIYGLFDAGVGEVSDSGVSYSPAIPIKDQILELYGSALATAKSYGYGAAYETDGKYIIGLPSTSADTSNTQQFVFDVYGRTWCRWTLNSRTMAVNPEDGKLYYALGSSAKVYQERKSYDYTDYADYGNTCTISSYTSTTVTINNTSSMTVGDLLIQGDSNAYIESINLSAGTVVIDATQAWTTGVATVQHLKAIFSKVEWNPDFAGNPAGFKQFYECSMLFKQGFQKAATVYFYTDSNPGETSVALTSSFGNGAWGEFVFGDEVWGGEVVKEPTRLGVPRASSRCNQLSVRFESRAAYSDFQLNGISLTFNPVSSRTAR